MKKLISILLALICCLTICSMHVFADENQGVLKADRVTAKAGDEITIPVSLVDHKGVCIIGVNVKYDSQVLEITDVISSATDSFGYTVNAKTAGAVIVLMDSKNLSNVDGDIKLFELKFKVKDDAPAGRTLVRVLCEDGMATYFDGTGEQITPVAFTPDTSTGAVTVLCAEHKFSDEKIDGVYKCENCGAVKEEDGNVSVDENQGLPEIDLQNQPEDSTTANSDDTADNDSGDKPKVKFIYFVPLIGALVIIGGTLVFVLIKRKNK